MIQYLHKQAEDHAKTREMLTQVNEELEREIIEKSEENKLLKKELELKSDNGEENITLKKDLEICNKIIEDLKSKEIDSSRKIEDLKDEHRYSELIQKVDKDNLERDLFEKSEECSGLLKQNKHLAMEVIDQKEEVNGLRIELKRMESPRTQFSNGSLSEELDSAYLKLENDLLKEEVGRMKVKIKHLERNRKERMSHLKHLEKLSSSRKSNLNKLKESLNILLKKKSESIKKSKCKYKWKCWWPKLCSYDHTYLYRKTNTSTAETLSEEKLEASETESEDEQNFECKDCNLRFKSRKKLRKHVRRVHRINCDLFQTDLATNINLKDHVTDEHILKSPKGTEEKAQGFKCVVCLKDFVSNVKLEEHREARHKEQTEETSQGETILAQADDEGNEDAEKVLSFKCEICRINFPHMKELEDHLNNIHLDELKCVFCKIEFTDINDMDKHMDLNHRGMWKFNDPDILREGDSELESEIEED